MLLMCIARGGFCGIFRAEQWVRLAVNAPMETDTLP
jgi:hypothetical protein